MKRNLILIPLVILILGALCFTVDQFFAPAPQPRHVLITEMGEDFFTDFNPNRALKPGETQAKASAPVDREPLLPFWDFRGPEMLQAQKAKTEAEQDIFDKYALRLEAIEQLANERLNTLAAKALAEYQQNKSTGKLSKLEFADKYYSALSLLQKNLDQTIDSELDDMKSELQEAQADTLIIEQLKTEYKNAKEKFQQELMQSISQQQL